MMGQLGMLLGIAAAVYVIYNVWNDQTKTNEQKLIWTIGAVMFSVITAIAYYLLEQKKGSNRF